MSEVITTPSRDRFREERAERRQVKKAEFRRKLIGVPLVLLGVSLIAAGAYVFFNSDADSTIPDSEVGGTSIVRESTTVPAVVDPNVVAPGDAVDPSSIDAGAGAEIPVVGDTGDAGGTGATDVTAETVVPDDQR